MITDGIEGLSRQSTENNLYIVIRLKGFYYRQPILFRISVGILLFNNYKIDVI